jgi:hypothetical protein
VPHLIVPLLGDYTVIILWRSVNGLVLLGADGADLKIITTQVSLGVEQWVNVQTRRGRASRDLAKLQYELLLQLIGHVVLGTEEDDTSLRDLIPRVSKWGCAHIDFVTNW